MPYHGIGSGILRALKAWPDIDFEDDRESSLFKAIVRRTHRPAENTGVLAPELASKHKICTRNKGLSGATLRDIAPGIAPELFALLERISANPRITTTESLATVLNVSRRTILLQNKSMLKEKGILRRIGPSKGGQWEILP